MVRISFDPKQISYGQLLKIYATVAHDPTQLNRQGPDVGPSYRSAIFPQSAGQRAYAARFIAQLRASGVKATTKIESGAFYPAEASHQDFMRRIFTFVVPTALIIYYPALFFFGIPDPTGLPRLVQFLSPLVGVGMLVLALAVWHAGLRRYQSTGS